MFHVVLASALSLFLLQSSASPAQICLGLQACPKPNPAATGKYLEDICTLKDGGVSCKSGFHVKAQQDQLNPPVNAPHGQGQSNPGANDPTCQGLIPEANPPNPNPGQSAPEAGDIIGLMGDPQPFALVAPSKNTILIYSTRPADGKKVPATLAEIHQKIAQLSGNAPAAFGLPAPPSFTVELSIPHASALGDLAGKINNLNFKQLTVENVGTDKVRISSAKQPECKVWRAFLKDVRDLVWQIRPEQPTIKLFYLGASASDVSNALNGSSGGSGSSPGGSGSGASPSAAGSTPALASTSPAGSVVAGANASPAPSGGTSATVTITQPTGTTTSVTNVTSGAATLGTSTSPSAATPAAGISPFAAASSPAGGSPGGSASPAASGGGGAQAAKAGGTSVTPLNPDMLIFSEATPGDDAGVVEKKRILAQLDLPRPEMIINAWVMQNSSTDPAIIGEFNQIVRRTVTQYNGQLQEAIEKAWRILKDRIAYQTDFFEPNFYHYVTGRFVANLSSPPASTNDKAAQSILDEWSARSLIDAERPQFGICPANRYCLGYTSIFQPLKPRLTDLLIAVTASRYPLANIKDTITAMENLPGSAVPANLNFPELAGAGASDCQAHDLSHIRYNSRMHFECFWRAAELAFGNPEPPDGPYQLHCESIRVNSGQIIAICPDANGVYVDRMLDNIGTCRPHSIYSTDTGLGCFDFYDPTSHHGVDPPPAAAMVAMPPQVSGVRSMRAAIADFLFQYKLSQQYPHEFAPYDLNQSAQTLNSALAPLIDAFNQDLAAYQMFLRAAIDYKIDRLNKAHGFWGHVGRAFRINKPSFVNDGIVTVRTISGQEAIVDTVSQSFVDVSTAPTLSQLAAALTTNTVSAPNPKAQTPPATLVTGNVLNNLSPDQIQVLLAGIQAFQSSKAQIGRELKVDVIPRSLAGAASAEIQVTLNADEASQPTFWGGAGNGNPVDLSRVAKHDTSTRVRVESIKLFEVSSFSAVLQRSHSRFPILPPFVELPYIGTLVGIPLPAAKEYHTSTAIISAVVVPTAADLALGLRFNEDRFVNPDSEENCGAVGAGDPYVNHCKLKTAVSLKDFQQPVRGFHKAMISCLATQLPYPSWQPSTAAPAVCDNLSFQHALDGN